MSQVLKGRNPLMGALMAGALGLSLIPSVPSPRRAQRRVKDTTPKFTPYSAFTERERIINSLTNWQSTQMMRACKGKVKNLTNDQLNHYAQLPHWKRMSA